MKKTELHIYNNTTNKNHIYLLHRIINSMFMASDSIECLKLASYDI